MNESEAREHWQATDKQKRIAALEMVIAMCKRKREDQLLDVDMPKLGIASDDDFTLIGFRGALAWVESELCEEINWLNEVGGRRWEPIVTADVPPYRR